MSNELKIQVLRDKPKSFELGRFTAQSKGQPVVVMDNNRAIMHFDAQGMFSEIQVAPLRVSIATQIMWSVEHDNYPTLALLKGFESRGGRL